MPDESPVTPTASPESRPRTVITPSDLVSLSRCAHRVRLDRVGDPAERIPAGAFLQLLWEGGREHEADVIDSLGVQTVPFNPDPDIRIEATKALMAEGPQLIYHGLLRSGALVGEPDILQRIDQPSDLGAFAYLPVEIKNAVAFEDDDPDKPKEPDLLQLCAYAELLEAAQGWRPTIGRIIDGNGEWHDLNIGRFRPIYELERARLVGILRGKEKTRPGWKAACQICVWQEHCWKVLTARDDVTTLAGIGEGHRERLWAAGVFTAAQLAAASPESLVKTKGIKEARAIAWTRQARAQKSGNPEILARWTPPRVDFEVSYDIEDFTPDPFVYLHGLLVRPSSAARFGSAGFSEQELGSFEPVCAELPQDDEVAVWRRFLEKVEDIDARGSYAVYVYSHHEYSTLTKLAGAYGGSQTLTSFLRRFVDLYDVVRESVVFPADGRGLKSLARWIGFEWRDEDPGGAQSMALWARYLDDPWKNRSLRDRLLAYNEDDVRASFVLRDWLDAHLSPVTGVR